MTYRSQSLLVWMVLLFGFISFSNFIADADLYGHLTVGERILVDREIPRSNDYSYTEPDHEWVNQYWLAEIILASIFKIGGSPALLLFQWLIGGIIILLLLSLVKKETPGLSGFTLFIIMVLSIGLIRFGLSLRPQLFTYLNTALLLQLLTGLSIQKKHFALLPVLFVFWVNVHGAVIAGLGVFLIWAFVLVLKHLRQGWWFRREFPKLFLLTVLILLATLINPYGFNLHRFLWFANGLDHSFLMEWQALDWTSGGNLFFKLAFSLYLGVVLYQLKKKIYVYQFYSLLSLVTAILALQYIRHIPFFGIVLPLALAGPLNHIFLFQGQNILKYWDQLQKRWLEFSPLIKSTSIIVSSGLVLLALLPASGFKLLTRPDYPVSQVKFLQEQKWEANLLNEYDWGYYLMRELASQTPITIDGRYETAYSVLESQAYLDFIQTPLHNLSYLDSSKSELALLRTGLAPARIVAAHPDWIVINSDENATLLGKTAFLEQQQDFDPALAKLGFPQDFLFK